MFPYQRPGDEHGALAAQICRLDVFGVACPHIEGPDSQVNLPDCGEVSPPGWSALVRDVAKEAGKLAETDIRFVNKGDGLAKVGTPSVGQGVFAKDAR